MRVVASKGVSLPPERIGRRRCGLLGTGSKRGGREQRFDDLAQKSTGTGERNRRRCVPWETSGPDGVPVSQDVGQRLTPLPGKNLSVRNWKSTKSDPRRSDLRIPNRDELVEIARVHRVRRRKKSNITRPLQRSSFFLTFPRYFSEEPVSGEG